MFYITGTVVGKVDATDRDQERTLHVKIKYSLLTGLDLFAINSETGVITTVTNTLDREVSIIVLMIYSEIQHTNALSWPHLNMLFTFLSNHFATFCSFR